MNENFTDTTAQRLTKLQRIVEEVRELNGYIVDDSALIIVA